MSHFELLSIEKDASLRIEFKNGNPNGRQSGGGRQRASAISSPVAGESDEFVDMLNVSSRKRGRKFSQSIQSRSRRNNSLTAQQDESSEDELEVTPSQFASPSSGYSQPNSVSGSYSQRSKYGRLTPPAAYDNQSEVQHRRFLSTRGVHDEPCGECEGCKRSEDCGNCGACRNLKFKQGRNRERCVHKTCYLGLPPSRRARMRMSSKISPNQRYVKNMCINVWSNLVNYPTLTTNQTLMTIHHQENLFPVPLRVVQVLEAKCAVEINFLVESGQLVLFMNVEWNLSFHEKVPSQM